MHIVNSEANFDSEHLQLLHQWFVTEWGEVDEFTADKDGAALPAPLVALDGGRLCGGLSFTRYQSGENAAALWVNALLVAPEYRGKGIASDLIAAAAQAALQLGETQLLALTDVPQLYLKQKWSLLKTTKDSNIVVLRLV